MDFRDRPQRSRALSDFIFLVLFLACSFFASVSTSVAAAGKPSASGNSAGSDSDAVPSSAWSLGLGSPAADSNIFSASMNDWWVYHGAEFLNEYLDKFNHSRVYGTQGLARSLVRCFLTTDDSRDCVEARNAFPVAEGQQRARLAVDSLIKFMGVMKLAVQQRIPSAFAMAGQKIQDMEYTRTWFNALNGQERSELHSKNTQSLLRGIFLTTIPWKSYQVWASEAQLAHEAALIQADRAQNANAAHDAMSLSPNKWDQLFDTPIQLNALDDIRRTSGVTLVGEDPESAKNSTIVKYVAEKVKSTRYAQRLVSSLEFKHAQARSWMMLKLLADHVARQAQFSHRLEAQLRDYNATAFFAACGQIIAPVLGGAINDMISGKLKLGESGASDMPSAVDLLGFGNLLDVPLEALLKEAPTADVHMADRLYHRAVNFALNAEKTWVTCTADFQDRKKNRVGKCESDSSGPQDFKACVARPDPQACYMYQWLKVMNSASCDNADVGRNTKPSQCDHWGTRFKVPPRDIIISSVLTKDMDAPSYRLLSSHLPITNINETSFAALSTIATTGAFTLPVCVSKYNFNSPYLDPSFKNYRIDVDYTQSKTALKSKSLPCNCGLWGSETAAVWAAVGIKMSDPWLGQTCVAQIRKKIKAPIERYIALCQINWSTGSFTNRADGWMRFLGRDEYCDTIVNTVLRLGIKREEELDPVTKLTILCRINGWNIGRCRIYKSHWKALVAQAEQWKKDPAHAVLQPSPAQESEKVDLVLLQKLQVEKEEIEKLYGSADVHLA